MKRCALYVLESSSYAGRRRETRSERRFAGMCFTSIVWMSGYWGEPLGPNVLRRVYLGARKTPSCQTMPLPKPSAMPRLAQSTTPDKNNQWRMQTQQTTTCLLKRRVPLPIVSCALLSLARSPPSLLAVALAFAGERTRRDRDENSFFPSLGRECA